MTEEQIKVIIGRELLSIEQDGEAINLTFAEGTIRLNGEGDCCAHAFLTDLDVSSDLPAPITEWNDESTAHTDDGHCDVRDTQFVKIKTTKGYIDFTLHTDHNGYYGGQYVVHGSRDAWGRGYRDETFQVPWLHGVGL